MSENVTRSISGLVYIALLIGATLFSEESFQILISIFFLVAIYEFCKLVNIKPLLGYSSALIFATIVLGAQNHLDYAYFNGVSILVLLYLISRLFKNQNKPDTELQKQLHLLGYIVLPFISLVQLPFQSDHYEPRIIIGVFILIWTNDTFAYITGKAFGKHKLFQRVSPKKTIEGFVGGIFFTLLMAFILSYFFTFTSATIWLIVALSLSVFGTIGDLVESQFKRIAKVKDSGTIMPGHGGILDRLDSIIFAAPFLYVIFKTFQ